MGRQFYETWCEDLKSLTTVSGLGDDKSLTAVSEIDTQLLFPCESPQKENFDVASFLGLGFTHHMIIVRKTNSLAERLFYIRQAFANKWSKEVLTARIEDDLFNHQGEIANKQLCTYLRLVDDQMRKPHENPSIGIVLCKSADKKYVEYVIQDYDKPLGVATYKTSDEMPEKLKKALPNIEELKKLL